MEINRNASCQQLINKDPVRYGWLRKKDIFHEKFNFKLMTAFKWPKMFAVLDGCCLYLYGNEMSSKPEKFYALYPFTGVKEWHADKESQEHAWSFALINQSSHKSRNLIFAASSKKEMKDWIHVFEEQMTLARKQSVAMPEPAGESENESSDGEDYEKIPEEKYGSQMAKSLTRTLKNAFLRSKSEASDPTPPLPAPRRPSEPEQSPPPDEPPPRRGLPVPPSPIDEYASPPEHVAPSAPTPVSRPQKKPLTNARAVLPPVPTKPQVQPKPKMRPGDRRGSATETKPPEMKSDMRGEPVGEEGPSTTSYPSNDSDYEVFCAMGDDELIAAAMWMRSATEGHEFICGCRENGVYLLRESAGGNGQDMTLVVSVNRSAKKFKVKFENAGSQQCTLLVNEPVYSENLSELIRYYTRNNLPCQGQQITLTRPHSAL